MLFFYVYFGTIVGAFLGHRIFYKWDELIADPLSTLSLLNINKGTQRAFKSWGNDWNYNKCLLVP